MSHVLRMPVVDPCRLFKTVLLSLLIVPTITACASSQPLPTLMVLLTLAPSHTASATLTAFPTVHISNSTPTLSSTWTPTATRTPTFAPTATMTPSPTSTSTFTATPIPDAIVASTEGANLRNGPNVAFEPPIFLLPTNTPLMLVAVSRDLLWYKVQTSNGRQGWVFARLLSIAREPPGLPVVDVPLPTAPAIIFIQSQFPNGNMGLPPTPISIAAVSSGGVSPRVMEIYQQGLQMGNNPRSFAKVGDSLTSNQSFMLGYGMGQYNLGVYSSLQDTVNYFSADAYLRSSSASHPGFSAAAVIDPLNAPTKTCLPNESPLLCEYRLIRPSIAFILFGSVDVQRYDATTFHDSLNQVVALTIGQGVIPVLTTFPYASNYYPEEAAVFNAIIRRIAASQQLPLIDLEVAASSLPGRGVGSDFFHMTQRGDDSINLTGDEYQYGATMRNLLTLQMLDTLRRGLGMN